MRLLVLVCPLTPCGGAIFSLERKPLEGGAGPRRVSSESGRFRPQLECKASMWLLADGLVSLSDGVCVFLGNEPRLIWLRKRKLFMLLLGKK